MAISNSAEKKAFRLRSLLGKTGLFTYSKPKAYIGAVRPDLVNRIDPHRPERSSPKPHRDAPCLSVFRSNVTPQKGLLS